MHGPLGGIPERRLIVGVNALDEFFGSRQTIPRIKTQNAVAFLRPTPDVRVGTPGPTACVAESLRLCQISLALTQRLFLLPQLLFGLFLLGNIHHSSNEFNVARLAFDGVSHHMDILNRSTGK